MKFMRDLLVFIYFDLETATGKKVFITLLNN